MAGEAVYKTGSKRAGLIMGNIIIIESEETTRAMVKLLLPDHSISEAKERQAARDAFNKGVEYDLIIVGELPGMDLVSFIKTIRAFPVYACVPVLVLSKELSLRQQFDISSAGATCWIFKPFTPEHFLNTFKLIIF